MNKPLYALKIQNEFERRKQKNPRYSLRAFARALDLNPGTLSSVLSGQRSLPEHQAVAICEKLGLSARETADFIQSTDPKVYALKESSPICSESFRQIFEEWEYFVILGTLRLKDFESTSEWIAAKTEITVERVEECISHLMTMGLISINAQGLWERTHKSFHSTHDVPSSSIRKSHMNNLEMSQEKLALPIDKRDYSFSTVALDKKGFQKLKKMTLKFRNDLFSLADSSSSDVLYRVSIQCFPLTKD